MTHGRVPVGPQQGPPKSNGWGFWMCDNCFRTFARCFCRCPYCEFPSTTKEPS